MNSLTTNANNSFISSSSSYSSPGFGKPKQNTTTIAEFFYSSEDNARYLLDPIVLYDSKENPESVLVVPSVLSSLSINATGIQMMEVSEEAMASGTSKLSNLSEIPTQSIDTKMMMTSNLQSESTTEVLFSPFPSDLLNRLSSRDRKFYIKFPNILPESADFNYELPIETILAGLQNSLSSPIERSWAQELTTLLAKLEHGGKKSRQKTRSALRKKENELYEYFYTKRILFSDPDFLFNLESYDGQADRGNPDLDIQDLLVALLYHPRANSFESLVDELILALSKCEVDQDSPDMNRKMDEAIALLINSSTKCGDFIPPSASVSTSTENEPNVLPAAPKDNSIPDAPTKVLSCVDASNSPGTNYTDSELLDLMISEVSDSMLSNCLSATAAVGNHSPTTSVTSLLDEPSSPAAAVPSRKPPNLLPLSLDQDVPPFPQLLEALTSPLSSLTERVWASDLRALELRQDSEDALAQYLELGQDFISYFDVKRALYSEPEFLFPRKQDPCYHSWMELLSALLRHPSHDELKQNLADQILFFYSRILNDDRQEDIDLLYSLRTQAVDHLFQCSIGIPANVTLSFPHLQSSSCISTSWDEPLPVYSEDDDVDDGDSESDSVADSLLMDAYLFPSDLDSGYDLQPFLNHSQCSTNPANHCKKKKRRRSSNRSRTRLKCISLIIIIIITIIIIPNILLKHPRVPDLDIRRRRIRRLRSSRSFAWIYLPQIW